MCPPGRKDLQRLVAGAVPARRDRELSSHRRVTEFYIDGAHSKKEEIRSVRATQQGREVELEWRVRRQPEFRQCSLIR